MLTENNIIFSHDQHILFDNDIKNDYHSQMRMYLIIKYEWKW